jgi:hypothetical protein
MKSKRNKKDLPFYGEKKEKRDLLQIFPQNEEQNFIKYNVQII